MLLGNLFIGSSFHFGIQKRIEILDYSKFWEIIWIIVSTQLIEIADELYSLQPTVFIF